MDVIDDVTDARALYSGQSVILGNEILSVSMTPLNSIEQEQKMQSERRIQPCCPRRREGSLYTATDKALSLPRRRSRGSPLSDTTI